MTTDEDGVSLKLKQVLAAIGLLLIALFFFTRDYFGIVIILASFIVIAPWSARMAARNWGSANWGYALGVLFSLVGVGAYWGYLKVRNHTQS